MRSAWAELPDGGVGTSIRASRCPLVATIRIRSGRSSQSTPLRMGRLSSVLAAKATCAMSFCRSLDERAPAAVELDRRKGGELLAWQAEQPELGAAALDRHPLLARAPVSRMAALGSSRTISTSLRAGSVIAPS